MAPAETMEAEEPPPENVDVPDAVVPPAATQPADAPPPMDEPSDAEVADWQGAVTGQIEAFRSGDGTGALAFAGQGFQDSYTDGDQFFSDIVSGGYAAIVQSRSHSFGEYTQPAEDVVLQLVKIVGPDQRLYEAMYQLGREEDGWKVQGVSLRQEAGIGV